MPCRSCMIEPSKTCVADLYGELSRLFSIFPWPSPQTIARPALLITLIVEGGIPVLLLFRRTRPFAVILGMLFHFVLGLSGFFSFSATMMAMLMLFLPTENQQVELQD